MMFFRSGGFGSGVALLALGLAACSVERKGDGDNGGASGAAGRAGAGGTTGSKGGAGGLAGSLGRGGGGASNNGGTTAEGGALAQGGGYVEAGALGQGGDAGGGGITPQGGAPADGGTAGGGALPQGGTGAGGKLSQGGGGTVAGGTAAGGNPAQGGTGAGGTNAGGLPGSGGATSCNIGSTVYPRNTVNPANACTACKPEVSATSWTLQSDGTSCDTGKICQTGTCKSGCWISSAFVASGTASPSDPCQICDPAISTTAWSPGTSAKCVQAITAGVDHSCAIVNGSARCWGGDGYGQLGDNSAAGGSTPSPVQVQGLTANVKAISAGYSGTCAIVNNGGAMCWGQGSAGLLGNNSTADSGVPVQVQGLTSGVTAVLGAGWVSCAIVNGALWCWGQNWSLGGLVPHLVDNLRSGVTAVASSGISTTACAVANGGAWCWGGNSNGEVGDGTTTARDLPVAVQGLSSGVTAIGVGSGHACALVNGGVRCWGANGSGQLGNNSTTNSLVPVQVQGLTSGVSAIAVGGTSSCALVNGSARCWGYKNDWFNGVSSNSLVPAVVQGLTSGVKAIAVGNNHICVIVNNAVRCWGHNTNGQVGTTTSFGNMNAVVTAETVPLP